MFIVTAKEMYDIDRHTMEEIGLPGHLLMENAGREIVQGVISLAEQTERITIFVGAGIMVEMVSSLRDICWSMIIAYGFSKWFRIE